LHKYDSELIKQAFRNVGLALPTDGSQDEQIKIKDLLGIQVGDWQSWTPAEGTIQPLNKEVSIIDTVMSNRTLQDVEEQAYEHDEQDNIVEEDECS
jgi:hypothetical protein